MKDGIGLFVGLVYSLNIVVGGGFLNLPYVFKQTGLLLSLSFMVFFSALSFYLSMIFLEVIHKGCIMKTRLKKIDQPFLYTAPKVDDISIVFQSIFGYKFSIIYLTALTVYFEGSLVAYSSIFAASFTSNIPLYFLSTCDIYEKGFYSSCIINYWIFLGLFGFIVIYLSLLGIKNQKTFQVSMCGLRYFIICLIIYCSIELIYTGKTIDGKPGSKPEPQLADFSKAHLAVPIIVFSLMYQLLLPSIAAIVHKRSQKMWKIVLMVTFIIFIIYSALGIIVPYAISNVKEQVSLNFRDYTGGQNEKNLWGYFVMYGVILQPAFDVIACFPFKTISLADNWGHMIYGDKIKSEKIIKVLVFVFGVVPLMFAAVFYNIAEVFGIVGLLPLVLFHAVVPIAHNIVNEQVKDKTSFDAGFYWRPLNYAITAGALTLFLYLLRQKINGILGF
ncbi:hypothetical protein SteCoe_33416 [Stentor coeruleus]|uniref:Amino acid transporter transmembrane domain-containing protein n=1 Tax=Stentor coeruleus TaxID=5963 RepID=A0A1R2AWV5_9CILI|nr:hypothetical protein SteCoe_33416 [Stentor coeruleus]